MPRLTAEAKAQIKSLSKKELEQIVLKIAAKEKSVYDFLLINYLDKESGEEELFEAAKSDIEDLGFKTYKGRAEEMKLANLLAACIKRVNEFTKISKNKVLEADLLLYVLDYHFSDSTSLLGTCFTQLDTKVGMITKRLITIVTTKLHEDYKVEYNGEINKFLKILHRSSGHVSTVANLPESI